MGGVHRLLGHLAVVPQVLPAGLLHRPSAVVAHLGHAGVRLAVGGIAQIEAIALVLAGLKGTPGVAAGAHRLGLQRLQRPGGAHLLQDDPLDIVVHGQHVDHGDVPAAPPVLEGPEIEAAPEVGLSLLPVALARVYRQIQPLGAVKLEQNLIRPRAHHGNPRAGGACHTGRRKAQGRLGLPGLVPVQIGPHPHGVHPVNPRREAALVPGGLVRRLLKAAVGAGQLQMPAAHGDVGGLAVVVARAVPVHPGAIPDVLGLDHGDGALVGVAQLLERPVLIKIAEAVALPHLVGQVGAGQGAAAVVQAHPDGGVGLRRYRPGAQGQGPGQQGQ